MFVNRLFMTMAKPGFAILVALFIWATPSGAEESFCPPADLHDLIVRLADSDRNVRTKAGFELKLYGQNALLPLIKTYRNGTVEERRGSVIGIGLAPVPAMGMNTLLAALEDKDVSVRSMAAHTLAIVGPPAGPYLVERLHHKNRVVRDAAGFGLKLMQKKAVPALIKGLSTDNEFARAKAAWLLGRIGPDARAAGPALIRSLDVGDPRVMHVVAEAIDLISPAPSVMMHHLIMLHSDTGCPVLPVGANAVPILIRLLSRPGTQLAQIAFHTLVAIGTPALPILKTGVQNGPMGKQVACALAMLEIDPTMADKVPDDVLKTIRGAQHQPKQ
jgi:HEAT repeat protein